MGFFDKARGKNQERKFSVFELSSLLFGGGESSTGATVNAQTAMAVPAVYSCVNVISQTIGMFPIHVYKQTGRIRERAPDHPLYRLLNFQPNSWQTPFTFKSMMQAHVLLRGNSYAWINWDVRGFVHELIPLHPDRVTVRQNDDYSLTYTVQTSKGTIELPQDEIFHLRGLSTDGYLGRAPLTDAREAVGVAIACQEYAGRFFRNDATPGVVLKHPGKLTDPVAKRLKDSWDASYGSYKNAKRTAILEEGMGIEKMTITAADAQFIETRKYTRSEICGFFRVPAHMVNDLEKATFSNIVDQSRGFIQDSIAPWIRNWEEALHIALFSVPETYYPRFNLASYLRGNLAEQNASFTAGRNGGWLSANDIREMMDLNPIEGGNVYLQPLNMTEAGKTAAQESGNGGANA